MSIIGTELDRRRRSVRCLELLDASHRAYMRRSELDASRRDRRRWLTKVVKRLADSAFYAAPDTHAAVVGGIQIGEVPNPDTNPQGWAEYVQIQRDGLARLEADV